MTVNMYIATCAWCLMIAGYLARFHRVRHVTLVVSAIALDLGLVLYLQFTRSAIQTALSFELELLQQIHIAFSCAALVLYFPVAYLGIKLLTGSPAPSHRYWHRRLAIAAMVLRTLGFVFMFSMWGGVSHQQG